MPPQKFYLAIGVIFLILFPPRFYIHQHFHRPLLDEYLEKTFQGKGVVVDEPEEKSFYTELVVKIESSPRTQKIIVQAPFYPKFAYGDEVIMKGKLKYPKDFKTDAGHVFHYQKYLAKDDIYYILSSPTITLLRKDQGNPVKSVLFSIKRSFIIHIQKVLPRPESSLMAGMLIAGKEGLGKDLENNFKKVGLIHIVVLSGYNVTIIAEAFVRILSFLPMSLAYGAGAVGIVLFTIMAGGGSTIIRASIMSLIALLGKLTGNIYSALRSLVIVGVLMVLWNPLILRYDPSFHLSFLATLALIVFSPIVKSYFGRFGDSVLGEMASSTLAVEFCLLPYLLYMSGSFAFVSTPANLLVIGFLPFTMLLGFLAGTLSYVSVFVAHPFALGAFVMLRYILRIVDIATGMTGWGIRL